MVIRVMQTSVWCLLKKRLSIWHSRRNRYFFAGCSKLGLTHLELAEQLTVTSQFELDHHLTAGFERSRGLHQHQMHAARLKRRDPVGRDAGRVLTRLCNEIVLPCSKTADISMCDLRVRLVISFKAGRDQSYSAEELGP